MIETYLNFVKENHVKLTAAPTPLYNECDISSPLKFIDAFKVEYPNLNNFQLLYIYINVFKDKQRNTLFHTPVGLAGLHGSSYYPIKDWYVFKDTVKYIAPITSPQTAISHDDYRRLQHTVALYPILFKD
jgi:hypothetical protein